MPDSTFGFVTGRFVILTSDGPDADNLPDVIVPTGKIIFASQDPRYHTSTPIPSTVFPARLSLSLDSEGYVLGSDGTRGAWIPVGTWKVDFSYLRGIRSGQAVSYTFQVLEIHTESSPLNLTLSDPPPISPTVQYVFTEQVKLDTEAARDAAIVAKNEAVAAAEEGGVFHVYDLSDLLNVTKSGPAVFHFDPTKTYSPPLPTGVTFSLYGGPMDHPGAIAIQDLSALLPGVKQILLTLNVFDGGNTVKTVVGLTFQNYADIPPAWFDLKTGLPNPGFQGNVLAVALDGGMFVWSSQPGGVSASPNAYAQRDGEGHLSVPLNPSSQLDRAISRYYGDSAYGTRSTSTRFNSSTAGSVMDLTSSSQVFRVLMNSNWTISSITSPSPGDAGVKPITKIFLILDQDGVGSRTLTLPASVKREPGFALSTGSGVTDIVSLTWVGPYVYAKMEAKGLL